MIIFIIITIIITFIIIKWTIINPKKIRKYFNNLSITVCGKRGKGKDTLMSYIAYGMEHNSNVKLQNNTNIIELKDLLIPELTRQKLVSGQFEKIEFEDYKKFKNMTFISDASIYFPNYEDAALKKEYTSLATSIAIWRHLYNCPIHFNVQNYDRLWKILREQIEDSIMCINCKYFKKFIYLKVRYYESSKDCVNNLKPIQKKLIGKSDDMRIEESKRYEIKDYRLIIPRYKVNHDSYYFKKIVFKE